jgi:hypothetical protein
VHHCEELAEMIKTDILFAIFEAQNQEILIPHQNQVEKNLEDTRRHATERGVHLPLGQIGRPHPRSADLWVPLLATTFARRFSTTLGFASPPLIEVGLI